MAYLALSPVSVGLYSLLNVAGLTALATFYGDDLPQAPSFPCVTYVVSETDQRGFGTGGLPEVTLRVHTFSTYAGFKEAQAINAKVIELLRDQAVTVSGYAQAGKVFYDDTTPVTDDVINGVKVRELVSNFRIFVEEA